MIYLGAVIAGLILGGVIAAVVGLGAALLAAKEK